MITNVLPPFFMVHSVYADQISRELLRSTLLRSDRRLTRKCGNLSYHYDSIHKVIRYQLQKYINFIQYHMNIICKQRRIGYVLHKSKLRRVLVMGKQSK